MGKSSYTRERGDLAAAEAAIETAFPEVEATSPSEWTNAFREFELADQTVTVFTLLAIAIGIHGQFIYMDKGRDLVVVILS